MVSTRSTTRSSVQPSIRSTRSTRTSRSSTTSFSHTPTRTTIIWLILSCALVTWDFCYVFLRPHSLPGGSLHFLWTPYALYGKVDYVYGVRAWKEHSGFTGAQSALNVVETAMYLFYMAAAARAGGTVTGKCGAKVLLVGFSAAVMTLSKTVLYWANEYFSGYANIGHNNLSTLITMWIIPNGLWIVMPSYMVYSMGSNILSSMTRSSSKRD
ncbi:hypothetical protein TD95_004125 [Thielaviopsis punctulata]|uniref:EXPERA domain-containing protein n=1 Tax=Thielaviopsis punctulata TaxID=72032 RepID=A0A0F4ZD99_9PEZI|nr:hypothetical protein TD95_004125 [Thielaviopsis punctulata]